MLWKSQHFSGLEIASVRYRFIDFLMENFHENFAFHISRTHYLRGRAAISSGHHAHA
jgi:hypothetical protein